MIVTSNLFFSCQFGTNQWPTSPKTMQQLGDVMGPYLDPWIQALPKFLLWQGSSNWTHFFLGGSNNTHVTVICGISPIMMAFFGLVVLSWPLCWLDRFVILQEKIEHVQENFQVCSWIVKIWTSFGQIDLFGSWINIILPFLANHTGGNKILVFPTTSSCCERYSGSSWRIGFKVKERYFPADSSQPIVGQRSFIVGAWWLIILFSFLTLGCDRITTVHHHISRNIFSFVLC